MARFWLDDEDNAATWTLQDVYDDLGSFTDVAAALDVTVWRLTKWISRRERINCPHPIKRIGHSDVYSIQEWRDWFARWCADPRRAKWLEISAKNGAGLPFFAHSGPDRGWPTRVKLKREQMVRAAALEAAGTEAPTAADPDGE